MKKIILLISILFCLYIIQIYPITYSNPIIKDQELLPSCKNCQKVLNKFCKKDQTCVGNDCEIDTKCKKSIRYSCSTIDYDCNENTCRDYHYYKNKSDWGCNIDIDEDVDYKFDEQVKYWFEYHFKQHIFSLIDKDIDCKDFEVIFYEFVNDRFLNMNSDQITFFLKLFNEHVSLKNMIAKDMDDVLDMLNITYHYDKLQTEGCN
tara:strand:- start:164 stop:778 length:615 start_codon:yes stop_codon:yes gene_type:complete